MNKSQLKVLAAIYSATDCSNDVFDCTKLHHTQEKVADSMPDLVTCIGSCVGVDDSGFIIDGKEGRGFRLTLKGYEALTASDPARWPADARRFASEPVRGDK